MCSVLGHNFMSGSVSSYMYHCYSCLLWVNLSLWSSSPVFVKFLHFYNTTSSWHYQGSSSLAGKGLEAEILAASTLLSSLFCAVSGCLTHMSCVKTCPESLPFPPSLPGCQSGRWFQSSNQEPTRVWLFFPLPLCSVQSSKQKRQLHCFLHVCVILNQSKTCLFLFMFYCQYLMYICWIFTFSKFSCCCYCLFAVILLIMYRGKQTVSKQTVTATSKSTKCKHSTYIHQIAYCQ